jgi:hypothetical protein
MRWRPISAIWLISAVTAFLTAGTAAATPFNLTWDNPWDLTVALPQFITHDYIDISKIEAISKFRSGAGHDFTDEYEAPGRSMKNYIQPFAPYRDPLGTNTTLPTYAPTTGTIVSIEPEQHILSDGSFAGYQVDIVPDGYGMFEIRLFHMNLAAGYSVGSHVSAGELLGFADMREANDTDIAVEAVVLATPTYKDLANPFTDRGIKLFSPFDLMTDALFGEYLLRGATSRDDFVISKAYRDANPADFATYNPDDWVFLSAPINPTPAPDAIVLFATGLALLLWPAVASTRRRRKTKTSAELTVRREGLAA